MTHMGDAVASLEAAFEFEGDERQDWLRAAQIRAVLAVAESVNQLAAAVGRLAPNSAASGGWNR